MPPQPPISFDSEGLDPYETCELPKVGSVVRADKYFFLEDGFRLESQISQSRNSTVFHATTVSGGPIGGSRSVALKFLTRNHATSRGGSLSNFRDLLNQSISYHPNIVRVHAGCADEKYGNFIVMELVHGVNLTEWRRNRTLSPKKPRQQTLDSISFRDIVEITRTIAQALRHMNQNGSYHNDLKPDNIIGCISSKDSSIELGNIRVADFGSVRSENNTDAFSETGTPPFIAPERYAQVASKNSDVFSIGMLMVYLFYDCIPLIKEHRVFHEDLCKLLDQRIKAIDMGQVQGKLHSWIHSLRHLIEHSTVVTSRSLRFIILTCLETDPSNRYQTVDELLTDLELWLATKPLIGTANTRYQPQPLERPIRLFMRCWRGNIASEAEQVFVWALSLILISGVTLISGVAIFMYSLYNSEVGAFANQVTSYFVVPSMVLLTLVPLAMFPRATVIRETSLSFVIYVASNRTLVSLLGNADYLLRTKAILILVAMFYALLGCNSRHWRPAAYFGGFIIALMLFLVLPYRIIDSEVVKPYCPLMIAVAYSLPCLYLGVTRVASYFKQYKRSP